MVMDVTYMYTAIRHSFTLDLPFSNHSAVRYDTAVSYEGLTCRMKSRRVVGPRAAAHRSHLARNVGGSATLGATNALHCGRIMFLGVTSRASQMAGFRRMFFWLLLLFSRVKFAFQGPEADQTKGLDQIEVCKCVAEL